MRKETVDVSKALWVTNAVGYKQCSILARAKMVSESNYKSF